MKWMMGTGVGLLMAASTAAQQPARTVQQDFDAATALDTGTDRAAALAAWEGLEKRTTAGGRSHAIVLVRKGRALVRLGRYEQGGAALRAGLAGLPVNDATLAEDRAVAYINLGQLAADTLDYAGAAAAFAKAEAAATDTSDKLGAMLGLAEVQTFTDPAAAGAALDRADALLATVKASNAVQAPFAKARGLLMLNTGNVAGARVQSMRAVSLLGGLTETVNLADVSARSDAAIALLLSGNKDEARRYMAMTGAGRLSRGSFDPAAEMRAPDCGGEAGLKPEEMAVVEFSIAPDGTVSRAIPIYAAGGGQVALEFARAVRGWSWPADKITTMPIFFRHNARVEMRCSTAFERPSLTDGLNAELEQWLAGKGVSVPPAPEKGSAAALVGQRAALTQAEASSPNSLGTLAALYRLTTNELLPREERAALAARGLAIAESGQAPAMARLALDLEATSSGITEWRWSAYDRAVRPLLDKPAYSTDPRARATIRLALADASDPGKGGRDRALALLRQVSDDGALRPNDPLRVGALIRIASIEERAGSPEAARTAFAATGLTADQCAIMDASPKLVSMPGSSAFPQEAQSWGFEGWAEVQYDVAANGRSANQRVVLAYPPFIFSKASSDFFQTARFAKTYRPDGGLGCGGTTSKIRFELPH